jgi:hypothetical protein
MFGGRRIAANLLDDLCRGPDCSGLIWTVLTRCDAPGRLPVVSYRFDPSRQTLEVLALDRCGQWATRGAFEGRANVRAAPFDAIELGLGALWI